MSGYEIYRYSGLTLGSGKWRPFRVYSVGSGCDKIRSRKPGYSCIVLQELLVHFGIVYCWAVWFAGGFLRETPLAVCNRRTNSWDLLLINFISFGAIYVVDQSRYTWCGEKKNYWSAICRVFYFDEFWTYLIWIGWSNVCFYLKIKLFFSCFLCEPHSEVCLTVSVIGSLCINHLITGNTSAVNFRLGPMDVIFAYRQVAYDDVLIFLKEGKKAILPVVSLYLFGQLIKIIKRQLHDSDVFTP